MIDLQFLLYAGIGTAILAAIALIGSHFSAIVSIVSGAWRRSMERARRQKAAREQLYGYAAMSSQDENSLGAGMVAGAGLLPSIRITPIDIAALAGSLTEAQYIELGARLVDRRGKFIFSGRNLYKLAGGNHDEFLANMRRWRGEEPEEPAYSTPIAARPTSARFEQTDADYPYQKLT